MYGYLQKEETGSLGGKRTPDSVPLLWGGDRMSENLLEVKHLKKYFKTQAGMLHAVDDVSFVIPRGKTIGVVGESGCGKSNVRKCR